MRSFQTLLFNNDSSFKNNVSRLGQLFGSFFKIAPATFGGGYAMIPLMYREIVLRRRWILPHDFSNVVTIAGSAPGAIAVNCATLVGYRLAGFAGAAAALIGVLLPTFLIVLLLCLTYLFFKGNRYIDAAFSAIRMSIIALIVYAAIRMVKPSIYDAFTFAFFILSVLLLIFTSLHPVWIIALGGTGGIIAVQVKSMFGLTVRLDHNEEKDDDKYKNTFIGDGI